MASGRTKTAPANRSFAPISQQNRSTLAFQFRWLLVRIAFRELDQRFLRGCHLIPGCSIAFEGLALRGKIRPDNS
ncbi:MAG TPA: hypothetical protein VHX20_07845, partial [Terracidiphilus sp.]|nr:hypothetical protein [Terracidiphilus sp.]